MSDAIDQCLSVIEAQLELVRGQLLALRHLHAVAQQQARPQATESLPPPCEGVDPTRCGKHYLEARMRCGGFGASRWQCRGCGEQFDYS